MKKRIVLCVILGILLSSLNVFLHAEEGEDCIRNGYIITSKNEKIEGMLWLPLDKFFSEKEFQTKVYFLPTEEFEALKKLKKKKFKKYGPKKIKGYGFDDFKLLSVKYADTSAASFAMFGKKYFLHSIEEGKINVFRYYQFDEGEANNKQTAELDSDDPEEKKKATLGYFYQILVQKDGGKLKNNETVNMKKLVGDCKFVYDKYLAGGYGFIPKNDGKKGGLKKLMSKVRDKKGLLEALPKIAEEYNAHMEGE